MKRVAFLLITAALFAALLSACSKPSDIFSYAPSDTSAVAPTDTRRGAPSDTHPAAPTATRAASPTASRFGGEATESEQEQRDADSEARRGESDAHDGASLPGMPVDFTFSSGSGGWGTEITLMSDGSFTGYYNDFELGSVGEGYPNGTVYECSFSGKFTNMHKTGDYEYSMNLKFMDVDGTNGEIKIIDGMRHIQSYPVGFDSADVFMLYQPGRRTDDLPEAFILWVHMPLSKAEMPSTLPFFGLYNVSGEKGFCSSPMPVPVAQPQVSDSRIDETPSASSDMFSRMSRDERKNLHTFFSNFSESYFNAFDINEYDENALVSFAISWNWINYRNRYSESYEVYTSDGWLAGNYWVISETYIDQALTRYFGVAVKHRDSFTPDIIENSYQSNDYYRDGYYYRFDAHAMGEPNRWSQVTAFIDNGDGTFTAYCDVYSGYNGADANIYYDKSDWNMRASDYRYLYSCVAVVTPYNYGGRATYHLISLKHQ